MTDKNMSSSISYTTQGKTYKTFQNLDKKKNMSRKWNLWGNNKIT